MHQRLYTVELRINTRELSRLDVFTRKIQELAQKAYTAAGLLGEADVGPEVVIYAHDYEQGHIDIPLFAEGDMPYPEKKEGAAA